jgi:IclR family mhp operon transcriptional activator
MESKATEQLTVALNDNPGQTVGDRPHKPYRDVRSLTRGMKILEALSELGWVTPTVLAARTGIDRATVYRLCSTLIDIGYVICRPADGKYFLTSKLRRVGEGIREEDVTLQLVSQCLEKLVQKIKWPSDYGSIVAGRLTILESNHRLSPMTIYRSLIGQQRPVLLSAMGRAVLSAMTEQQLKDALETIRRIGGEEDARAVADEAAVGRVIAPARALGYATSEGLVHPNISALAVPVRGAHGVVGAVNVVFFKSAMSAAEAVQRYLEALKDCVREIEEKLDP